MTNDTQEKSLTQVLSPKFLVRYPHILKPAPRSEPPEYRMRLLIPKTPGVPFATDGLFTNLRMAAKAAKEAKFGVAFSGYCHSPFKDGDTYILQKGDNTGKLAKLFSPEIEGHIVLDVKSKTYPVALRDLKSGKGPDGKYLEIKDPSKFYDGCFAICWLNAYAYERDGSKGIAFGLGDILKVGEGQRIASASRANQDFTEADVSQYSMDDSELFGGAPEDVGV